MHNKILKMGLKIFWQFLKKARKQNVSVKPTKMLVKGAV